VLKVAAHGPSRGFARRKVALHSNQPYHVHPSTPEWRNWYTHQTQNLASFTAHVGSSPTSGTITLFISTGKRHIFRFRVQTESKTCISGKLLEHGYSSGAALTGGVTVTQNHRPIGVPGNRSNRCKIDSSLKHAGNCSMPGVMRHETAGYFTPISYTTRATSAAEFQSL
jgi:hypothetical protein